MRERTVRRVRAVHAHPAGERGVLSLHPFDRVEDDLLVPMIHTSVPVEIVHASIAVVVHKDIGGISVHVPAYPGPTIASRPVVLRRPEATHHSHMTNSHALGIQIG